ncbi:MAG TPA: tetratricopeptide repeat protein, partial [Bacteroidota bacterium]|nr:tetratricopeptide repeat protein [Bacteroidota bacterium]
MTFPRILTILSAFGVLWAGIISGVSSAQGKSPVLRDPAAERSPFYLKVDRSTEEMFNAFLLVKKANTGDPVARHELGLRYLTGRSFAPDTPKAALWIGRAAEQKYVPAIYNFGILRNNGWGTPWDPFGAFLDFRTAARKGLVEGEYMYGLFLTDDLVVRRDYAEAYRWIRAAADSGYTFAEEVLRDFNKTGIMARIRTAQKKAAAARAGKRDDGVDADTVTSAGMSRPPASQTPAAPPQSGGSHPSATPGGLQYGAAGSRSYL